VYTNPELGLRLAQGKIEEARSRARRASTGRAAGRDPRVTAEGDRNKWTAPMRATATQARAKSRSLRSIAPRTTKG
jgi:hypothetical protein